MRVWLLLTLFFAAWDASAYYGRNSIEANLTFEAVLDTPWNGKPKLQSLNAQGDTHIKALKRVHEQILFLDGVFHSPTFAARWGGPASCGPWYEPGTYEVDFLEVLPSPIDPSRVQLKYRFKSKIVVEKDPLRRKESARMELWLPVAPDLIYELSTKWNKNQCTDREDDAKENFYYYWNPFQKNCPLMPKHPESIQWIDGTVDRLPNTRISYPQYDELYQDKQNEPTVKIAFFLGYISHGIKARRPYYKDDAYKTLKIITANLQNAGFEETEFHPNFYLDKKGKLHEDEGANVWRQLKKTQIRNGRPVSIEVDILLSDTQTEAKDTTFRQLVRPALNEADIFIYDGHSGDGDVLDPDIIDWKPSRNPKYQLYFLNGCDSYMNYLQKFLKARVGGNEKLDLILSSTPTLSDLSAANNWAFLQSFIELKTFTYQTILDRLEKSNGEGITSLTGIVGDENNTWKP